MIRNKKNPAGLILLGAPGLVGEDVVSPAYPNGCKHPGVIIEPPTGTIQFGQEVRWWRKFLRKLRVYRWEERVRR